MIGEIIWSISNECNGETKRGFMESFICYSIIYLTVLIQDLFNKTIEKHLKTK